MHVCDLDHMCVVFTCMHTVVDVLMCVVYTHIFIHVHAHRYECGAVGTLWWVGIGSQLGSPASQRRVFTGIYLLTTYPQPTYLRGFGSLPFSLESVTLLPWSQIGSKGAGGTDFLSPQ